MADGPEGRRYCWTLAHFAHDPNRATLARHYEGESFFRMGYGFGFMPRAEAQALADAKNRKLGLSPADVAAIKEA